MAEHVEGLRDGSKGRKIETTGTNGRVPDVVSVERTDALDNATTFRRGSPTNLATCASGPNGTSAVISETGIGAFGMFLKNDLSRRAKTPAERRA